MNHVVVQKSQLNEMLEGWKNKYRVAAPVRNDGGVLEFGEVSEVSGIVLNDEIPYKSPKEFLFPQVEKIMTFDLDNQSGSASTAEAEDRMTIVLGVKPCDLEALKVMTAVFTKGKYVDNYFVKNLDNLILAGMGCMAEKPGCFCGDRGIDKSCSRDCDIFFVDRGDSYLVEIITEKGARLLEGYAHVKETIPAQEAMPASGTSAKGSGILEINADENTLFNKIDWAVISEKCLGCGTCTFICPTCHCFEFRDTNSGGAAARYRCWDSCMYPKFTLHASGHNPRTSKKERYRQRILHKYVYVKKNFGYTACTGCGRCIRSCPVGMDIKSVVNGINKELANM